MKKKLFTILSTVVFTIMLGYLFLLSWLIGFLASKYVAGKSTGERGKVRSIVIPLRRWAVHLHHWLYSLFLVSLSFTTGMHFLTPEITYGLLRDYNLIYGRLITSTLCDDRIENGLRIRHFIGLFC